MQFGLSESVEHWGRYRPSAIAVVSNGTEVPYRELNNRVNALCAVLRSKGFAEPRIAVAGISKLDTLVAYLAVLRLAKSVIVLNSALNHDAIRTNLKDTGAKEFICHSNRSEWYDLFPSPPRMALLEDVDWNKEIESVSFQEARPDDEWGVLFSSGSTGTPKAIERDQYSMITELIGWCLELQLCRHTRFYIGRPIYYTGGLVLLASVLLAGGAIIINDYTDDNDPTKVWADYQSCANSHKIQWAFFIPDQLRAFVNLVGSEAISKADGIVVMGAPITASEKLAARARLGSGIVESWGNSESLGTITDPEDLDTRPGSVGRPFLTDAILVVDDDGRAVPSNTVGKIAGGQEAGFAQYSSRPDATERVKRNDLIISDDVGYVDEHGYLFIRGREQDSFIVGGTNYFVRDLEDSLKTAPGISELVIVPLSSETGDAILRGLVVRLPNGPETDIELRGILNARLAAPITLDRIVIVERIPRVPSGKIDKSKCKELAMRTT